MCGAKNSLAAREARLCGVDGPQKGGGPVREGLTRLNTLPVERVGRNAYTYFHSV